MVIRLYNGTSIALGQQYLFVFDSVEEQTPHNPEYMMETDYYINQGKLKFTRDYGKTWLETDITSEDLNATLSFYRSNALQPNSWFLSTNELVPIAYFYGEEPVLKLSKDKAKTWREVRFLQEEEVYKTYTRRVVGFISENFGYVALGTEWSMGSGEEKKIFFTYDGGENWIEIEAPRNGTSATLIDLSMYDKEKGIIMLDNCQDVNMPEIHVTVNGGKNWNKIEFSYFNLSDEIRYLTDVDSITYENGEYYIKLGQGGTGTLKAIFKTRELQSPWQFVSTKKENIHTVG